ncbi:MAG TPA: hypothetical protein VKY90_10080 [Candidatus Dormibacteraeota bacterium]|nr:hypothetical protein [Candidatus Dormibacteraeota bacterium]
MAPPAMVASLTHQGRVHRQPSAGSTRSAGRSSPPGLVRGCDDPVEPRVTNQLNALLDARRSGVAALFERLDPEIAPAAPPPEHLKATVGLRWAASILAAA